MSKSVYLQTGSRSALLVGQFIVLMVCVVYIAYIYFLNILPDKLVKEYYKKTECFLISKKLKSRGLVRHQYRSDFLISYNVAGVQYNRWVHGNGLEATFGENEVDEEDTLTQFDVGGTYKCWYNPDDPAKVVLVMRHNWLSALPMILPASIGIIVLYYLIKNLFLLSGVSSVKSPLKSPKLTKKKKEKPKSK